MRAVTIHAPASGVVLSVAEESARPVLPGAPLVSIGNPADLEIVADLLSSDAVRLPAGAMAQVERWGGQPLTAQLVSVEPVARTEVSALGIEEQRVDAVFDLLTPWEERQALGHNFAVYLRITEWAARMCCRCRYRRCSAMARTGRSIGWRTGWPCRAVDIGRRGEMAVELLDGLAEGDRVVTHPPSALVDGGKVAER